MKYHTLKKRINDLRNFNFNQAIEIVTLRNQGWTFDQIGESLGLSHQRVMQTYKYVSTMSVEDLELYQSVMSKIPLAKNT